MSMDTVRPKKRLGQHFLKDRNTASRIVSSLTFHNGYRNLAEIGPGTGILTGSILEIPGLNTRFIEVDRDSVAYLRSHFPGIGEKLVEADFLREDLSRLFDGPFGIIGNFPYNISSQIFFRVLDNRDRVEEVVGMLQKEVADRIASAHGNKVYGILSVLLQAFFRVEKLFEVSPGQFNPPPKVMSTVIRLRRNDVKVLDCDENLFFMVVKQGFQNRRKTLRNALKPINLPVQMIQDPVLSQRAEQLPVEAFIDLTRRIEQCRKS